MDSMASTTPVIPIPATSSKTQQREQPEQVVYQSTKTNFPTLIVG